MSDIEVRFRFCENDELGGIDLNCLALSKGSSIRLSWRAVINNREFFPSSVGARWLLRPSFE